MTVCDAVTSRIGDKACRVYLKHSPIELQLARRLQLLDMFHTLIRSGSLRVRGGGNH